MLENERSGDPATDPAFDVDAVVALSILFEREILSVTVDDLRLTVSLDQKRFNCKT